MRKRRRTVYVSPGKDVTLYVPADTPRVVIDYLNHLKDEGQFSQGVMDILIHHVTGQTTTVFHQTEVPSGEDLLKVPETALPSVSFASLRSDSDALPVDELDSSYTAPSTKPPFHLKMADIFRQPQKKHRKTGGRRARF
ncbi:hypothetical protein [Alicyclobacillus ferrooxydans]|uniref:Uncharacterized protein n=1 Tax=Alicyclobacillus ferrooxydans TaxID=471514 RepID=A0A0P9CNU3_9BACL|nr:hypothetical protein [Alicyclobacillus ferrooxydans]KPV44535.1 hypothetical protein AN477_05870 [Alicyclobacillus ferrooxydans]